jgi:hypothetical protein
MVVSGLLNTLTVSTVGRECNEISNVQYASLQSSQTALTLTQVCKVSGE